MNALDNEREGRATDVLLNYETVGAGPSRLRLGAGRAESTVAE